MKTFEMKEKANVYFVGIGGIGMSALARYYRAMGKNVAGYDRTCTALTRQMEEEGIAIHYEDDVFQIPQPFCSKSKTLVVVTPAVPEDNRELVWFYRHGFDIVLRAEALGEITKHSDAVCVAGTHGKTTVSSMITHIFTACEVPVNAFVGGITNNAGSNLVLSPGARYTVVEADEYNYSFYNLRPLMAVITSVSPDHLDIYGTAEAYTEAFSGFTALIRHKGTLLMDEGVKIENRMPSAGVYRYGIGKGEGNRFYARNIRYVGEEIWFDFVAHDIVLEDVKLQTPIMINVRNAVGAMAAAMMCGIVIESVKEAMASYRGVKRRFEFHIKTPERVLIDDYAHHPDELKAAITSVRELYPDRALTVVFQPHLYSRTRDFGPQFASALDLADRVILLPIYPAREEPIAGVSSASILEKMNIPDKRILSKAELLEQISDINPDVLLMAGAGDIELLVEPVKQLLRG